VAWLGTRTDKSAICRLVRIDWQTVGRIIERVGSELADGDRLSDLFEIRQLSSATTCRTDSALRPRGFAPDVAHQLGNPAGPRGVVRLADVMYLVKDEQRRWSSAWRRWTPTLCRFRDWYVTTTPSCPRRSTS